jgi:DNA repair protein RAD5
MNQIIKILEETNNYISPLDNNLLIDANNEEDLNKEYFIFSIDKDNNLIIGNKEGILCCKYKVYGLINNIILDILNNKNTLYSYKIKIHPGQYSSYYSHYRLSVLLTVFLDINKLKDDIKSNQIYNDVLFTSYVYSYINRLPVYDSDFWKKARILKKKDSSNLSQPNLLDVKLYTYQLKTLNWMKNLEKNIDVNKSSIIETSFKLNEIIPAFKNHNLDIEYDILERKLKKSKVIKNYYCKGGILADEMGLGKTITSVGLILENPANFNSHNIIDSNGKYNTRATLIISPNHLIKQWNREIKKGNPMLKTISILTKTNHGKISIEDIINADVVLVSQQFLTNFKYYVEHNYKHIVPSQIMDAFDDRMTKLTTFLDNLKNNSTKDQLETLSPNFEFFNWHRIIVDEGHELFGGISSGNVNVCNYLKKLLTSLSSKYLWYISGTPFVNTPGLISVLEFIDFKLENSMEITKINSNNEYVTEKINTMIKYRNVYNHSNIILPFNNNILDQICYRNTKENVINELSIPPILEEVVMIKLSDIERELYDSKVKYNSSELILRQLCCHPLISDKERGIFGTSDLNLDQVKDGLIIYHNSVIEKYSKKITELDIENQSYHMLKKNFTDKVNESKYLVKIFENLNNKIEEEKKNDMCCICMDNINQLVVTDCGHFYCKECIYNALKFKKECPNCRKSLDFKKIYLVDKKEEIIDIDDNILVKKYGSKMGKLIEICKRITNNKNNRIIIFSQWDRLLHLIGNTLKENKIKNTYVKGNVYQRNNAIDNFRGINDKKKNNNIQVIMLSLENAASGTNLTEATHIIFTDPIIGTIEEKSAIENQAIGRACRIGQDKQVKVIKLIIKDTIEEKIFNNNTNNNIQVINV